MAAGNYRRLGDVNAQLAAHGRQLLGIHIVAEGRDQAHIQSQKAHVVGNVAAHAAGTHAYGAGIGIPRHQLTVRTAADVHVHTAHHGDIRTAGDDVPLPGDAALFHQVGDMHRYAGAGDPRTVRQLLLGDHGVRLDPVEDLSFSLRHGFSFHKQNLSF